MKTYTGGCHCGAVKYQVDADEKLVVQECNCSMCHRVGFLHLIVPASRFCLVQGQDALTRYTFNTGVAQHLFCKHCGVKSFYVPRSNPNGFSINVRCLDHVELSDITIQPFDGRNWEKAGASLAHLSQE
jgi:hypothetical protein